MEQENHLSKHSIIIISVVLLGGLLWYAYQYSSTPDNVPAESGLEDLPFTVSHTPIEIVTEQENRDAYAVQIALSSTENQFEGTLAFSVEDILTEAGESVIADNYLPAYVLFPELTVQAGVPIENQLIVDPTSDTPAGSFYVLYEIRSVSADNQQGVRLFSVPVMVR